MLKRRNREPCRNQHCNAAPRIAQQAMHGPPISMKHNATARVAVVWLPEVAGSKPGKKVEAAVIAIIQALGLAN